VTQAGTFTISDTGIGMSREELVSNLGTIARSGSRAFVAGLEGDEGADASGSSSNIVGQFGVGFYSTFMVGHKVTVYSRPVDPDAGPAHVWTSDGSGSYSIAEASDHSSLSDRTFLSDHPLATTLPLFSGHLHLPSKAGSKMGRQWAVAAGKRHTSMFTLARACNCHCFLRVPLVPEFTFGSCFDRPLGAALFFLHPTSQEGFRGFSPTRF
jgi:hypothetical protein